jgi:cobalamin biosynthesis Mg chelatase CobN
MSEGSLPFFASLRSRLPRRLRPSRASAAFSRLFTRNERQEEKTSPSPLESRAARLVREYLRSQATNLERAERLGERAERLEKAGIPSESARNRAERARDEVMVGLAALRGRFVEAAGGGDGARAFDRVVELLCPTFKPLY